MSQVTLTIKKHIAGLERYDTSKRKTISLNSKLLIRKVIRMNDQPLCWVVSLDIYLPKWSTCAVGLHPYEPEVA